LDDYNPIWNCRNYVDRLRAAGAHVTLTGVFQCIPCVWQSARPTAGGCVTRVSESAQLQNSWERRQLAHERRDESAVHIQGRVCRVWRTSWLPTHCCSSCKGSRRSVH